MTQYIRCVAALFAMVGVADGQHVECGATDPEADVTTAILTYCESGASGLQGAPCHFTVAADACDTIDADGETCTIQVAPGYSGGSLTCNDTVVGGAEAFLLYGEAAVANPCTVLDSDAQTGFDYSSCIDADVTGDTCTPVCATGYTASGVSAGFAMVCSTAGEVDVPPADAGLTCTANACSTLDADAQVGFDYSSCLVSGDVTGTLCTPVCATGYDSGGTVSAGFTPTCSSTGEMDVPTADDPALVCTPIVCATVTDSTDATLGFDYSSCLDGETTGSTCTPTCMEGYNPGNSGNGGLTTVANPITLLCTDTDATDGVVNAGTFDAANPGTWANSAANTGLNCQANVCTAGSGADVAYACSLADDPLFCVFGGSGNPAPVVVGPGSALLVDEALPSAERGFGAVTCAAGYGTGELALAAGNGPKVTCLSDKDSGDADAGVFAFTGCHGNKCNAITGPITVSNPLVPFVETDCDVAGTKILGVSDLDKFCEASGANGCASSDCCTNIDECTELDDPNTASRVDASGDAMHGCAGSVLGQIAVCTDADPTNSTDNGMQGTTLALHGDTAGTTSSTHTCTCISGYFGDGDASGTGCTQCTAVANSVSVACTTAQNSRAICVEGAILVPAASTSTADVCRLECPFVELMALIDTMQPTCPQPAAGDDVELSKNACEEVPGCYYIPATATPTAHSCAPIYPACKLLSTEGDCTGNTTSPQVWGSQTVHPGIDHTHHNGLDACMWSTNGGTPVDQCVMRPSLYNAAAADTLAGYNTVRTPIVRCTALLNTGWAHDLRGSCDGASACPLHTAGAVTGLVGEIAIVFPADAFPDLDLESEVNGVGTGAAHKYFSSDAGDLHTTFEVCSSIRDAVNAAPTCSSDSG